MDFSHHFIRNFPKKYPLWKRAVANVYFSIGVTLLSKRKNALTTSDKAAAKAVLKPGDLVLVGNLRRAGHLFIPGLLTHSLVYVGRGECIHAHADGVEKTRFDNLFKEYDTLMLLRFKKNTPAFFKKLHAALLSQLGTPYDYEFLIDLDKDHPKAFYCTELIVWAFKQAGKGLHLVAKKHPRMLKKAIHPMDFIGRDFQAVFASKGLLRRS